MTELTFKHTGTEQYLRFAQNAIDYFGPLHSEELGRPIKKLGDLRLLARRRIISPNDLFRLRGMGDARNPGKLALYLFPNLKSREQQKIEKAILFAGDGI